MEEKSNEATIYCKNKSTDKITHDMLQIVTEKLLRKHSFPVRQQMFL